MVNIDELYNKLDTIVDGRTNLVDKYSRFGLGYQSLFAELDASFSAFYDYLNQNKGSALDPHKFPEFAKISVWEKKRTLEAIFNQARDEAGKAYAESTVEEIEDFLILVEDRINYINTLRDQSREELFKDTILPRISEGAVKEAIKSHIEDVVVYAGRGDLWDYFHNVYGLDVVDDADMYDIVETHVRETTRQMLQKL